MRFPWMLPCTPAYRVRHAAYLIFWGRCKKSTLPVLLSKPAPVQRRGRTIMRNPSLQPVSQPSETLILQAVVTPSYVNRLLLRTVELAFRRASLDTRFGTVGWQQWQKPYSELKGPEDENWWRILWQSGFSSEDAKSETAPKEGPSKPLPHLEFIFTLQSRPFLNGFNGLR